MEEKVIKKSYLVLLFFAILILLPINPISSLSKIKENTSPHAIELVKPPFAAIYQDPRTGFTKAKFTFSARDEEKDPIEFNFKRAIAKDDKYIWTRWRGWSKLPQVYYIFTPLDFNATLDPIIEVQARDNRGGISDIRQFRVFRFYCGDNKCTTQFNENNLTCPLDCI